MRIHGLNWVISIDQDRYLDPVRRISRYTLGLTLTRGQALALMETSTRRGCPTYRYDFATPSDCMLVQDIEITAAEANAIRHGTDPVEALGIGMWPEYGYRLHAVPVKLSELTGKKS